MAQGWVLATLFGVAAGASITAAELQSRTVAAFDRYVRATESRLKTGTFLWVDGLTSPRRSEALGSVPQNGSDRQRLPLTADLVRAGRVTMYRFVTRESGYPRIL